LNANYLADFIKDTPQGREADAILRKCVHCGFCTATCPTYQLLGDELDGPRGRIYLMKQVLEGAPGDREDPAAPRPLPVLPRLRNHLPVGRALRRLLDIGRHVVEQRVGRGVLETLKRRALRAVIRIPHCSSPCSGWASSHARSCLPALKRKVPPAAAAAKPWPQASTRAPMLVARRLRAAQSLARTNAAAARVLDRLGIMLLRAPAAGCCGAVSLHLNAHDEALAYMRRNIDAWWPYIEQGVEAIVMTASGCATMVADYGICSRTILPTPKKRHASQRS